MTDVTSEAAPQHREVGGEVQREVGRPLVGVLGAGQLGRMLALAGLPMALRFRFLDQADSGATDGLGESMFGDWTDPKLLARFAEGCDVITVENEWAPVQQLEGVLRERGWDIPLRPGPAALGRIADKIIQKQAYVDAGLPVGAFRACASREEVDEAAAQLGYPLVAKRPRGSYDGYGNMTVRGAADLDQAWERLHDESGLLLEAMVPFEEELAVLAGRRPGGELVTYPVVRTIQRDHRCHAVLAPSGFSAEVEQRARELAAQVLATVGHVGVAGVELFALADGQLLVNELAPRPHNTGHFTIDACASSQFETHLRAVLDWPFGDTSLREPVAAMVNVLGDREGVAGCAGVQQALAESRVWVHLYGKRGVRAKRKMGHVTAVGSELEETLARAERAAAHLRP